MRRYLTVCRVAQEHHLLWKLGERHHLIDTTHMYSLQDLVETHTGDLPTFLQSMVELFTLHIKAECEVCGGQGHICEVCSNDEVIFPFEAGAVVCDACSAVFHRACWTRRRETCPKCHRLKTKASCENLVTSDDNELGDIN